MGCVQGFALVVCLMLIAIATLLGLTAMQGSVLHWKMADHEAHRQQVLQAAEYGLRYAENWLTMYPPNMAAFDREHCHGVATNCVNLDCVGGYCFLGRYTGSQMTCERYDKSDTNPVWLNDDLNIWKEPSKHLVVPWTANNNFSHNPKIIKYIVEFQCFIGDPLEDLANDLGEAYYRVTVLASSETEDFQVMLQSTISQAVSDIAALLPLPITRHSWREIPLR